jgi:blue light- and temperature-responsive anti-repressor
MTSSPPGAPVYSLTYCSRNLVQGSPSEVRGELRSILDASRRNNHGMAITGALLYNAGSFAQVLEGPLENVGRVFEVIQRDARHGEVTVIEAGFADARRFPRWAMAFAGGSSFDGVPEATDAFEAVFADVDGAGEQMLTLLRGLMTDDSEWLLVEAAVPA